MKRLIITLSLLFAPILMATASVGQAGAVDIFNDCGQGSSGGNPAVCQDIKAQGGDNGSNNPVVDTIKVAIDVLSWIIGIAAIIGVVVSGFRMVVNASDPKAVAEARGALVYSLIGVAVAILAQTIVVFVLSKIT